MSDDQRKTLMQLYRAFNDRDIESVLAHLAPGVDWPVAATGGRVSGRDAVRDYWTRQWSEIDPRVEPLDITFDAAGTAHVRVDQLIRTLDGKVLANNDVEHVYEFSGPFIARMTIVEIPQDDDEEEEE
jgi:hypothetical protein